mgnify:CR=1 FL=1
MGTPKVNSDFADARFRQFAPALGKVGQYQMSAVPYISSSIAVPAASLTEGPLEVALPSVTRFVTVTNEATGSNKPLRVGFSFFGVSGSSGPGSEAHRNYFILDNGESYTGEWRVSKLYLLGASAPILDNSGDPLATSANVYPTTASVIAGLTGIPHDALMANWSGSSGVG